MAYTREGKEVFEVDYPVKDVWEAIPKAVAKLEWTLKAANETTHHVEVKTKGAFLSYGSEIRIDLEAVDPKMTKMSISAETPVTTITSMADYGRTSERIEVFIATMGKIMSGK